MTKLLLFALAAPGLFANAIFTAPAGCTAIAPAPGVTGVQCFGSFTGGITTVASFSGTGSGLLFATGVLFEWDFTSEGMFPRVVNALANVNGRAETMLDISFGFSKRHMGSFQLPVTFGETLNFWQFAVDSQSSNVDIPITGIGLRLLVNHTPPSTAIPEPATAAALALGLGVLLLGRHRRQLPLFLLLAPGLFANAIFTAPTGCTSIAPAPDVTGVQCFGSFTGNTSLQASFAGGGSGPLWATSATFDYDFTTSSLIVRAITVITAINGSAANTPVFVRTFGAAQETGSLTIPLAYGEALDSWLINVSVGTATPDGSLTLDIPTTGVGLRLLVNHTPPSSAVPEPATAGLCGLAVAALLLKRVRGLLLLPLLVLAPLAAAPIFTAPAGCTAIQTAPNIEGVQCYGDTGLVRGATPELSFAGGGTGPLWATEVIFEWDFTAGGGGGNIVPVLALVNGEPGSTIYGLTFDFTTPYSGSLRIPYTPGTPLSRWSILVQAIVNSAIGGESRSVATPLDGEGLRLWAVNQPPAAVPEPGTAALSLLALAGVTSMRAARWFRTRK